MSDHKTTDITAVKIGGVKVLVDVAITKEEHNMGLSFRTSLSENQGMLFVFEYPDTYGFWMKDMNFPIDMIWISEDKKIVSIRENALPESYPESYSPKDKSKYVLEVAAGFSDKNNLKEGDQVTFTY